MKTPTNAYAAHLGAPAMSRVRAGVAVCAASQWYGIGIVDIKPFTVFAGHDLRARRLEESSQ